MSNKQGSCRLPPDIRAITCLKNLEEFEKVGGKFSLIICEADRANTALNWCSYLRYLLYTKQKKIIENLIFLKFHKRVKFSGLINKNWFMMKVQCSVYPLKSEKSGVPKSKVTPEKLENNRIEEICEKSHMTLQFF